MKALIIGVIYKMLVDANEGGLSPHSSQTINSSKINKTCVRIEKPCIVSSGGTGDNPFIHDISKRNRRLPVSDQEKRYFN